MRTSAQEPGVSAFYDELFKHWNVRLRKSKSSSSVSSNSVALYDVDTIELEDSGDESGDLSLIMEIKSDPYCVISTPDERQKKILEACEVGVSEAYEKDHEMKQEGAGAGDDEKRENLETGKAQAHAVGDCEMTHQEIEDRIVYLQRLGKN